MTIFPILRDQNSIATSDSTSFFSQPLLFVSLGELRTATAMDREMTPTYKLIAQATDGGGLFCRSDISLKVLDVNDNAPSFSSTHYLASVYENAAPKALLTRLQASDPDEGKLLCDGQVTNQARMIMSTGSIQNADLPMKKRTLLQLIETHYHT